MIKQNNENCKFKIKKIPYILIYGISINIYLLLMMSTGFLLDNL